MIFPLDKKEDVDSFLATSKNKYPKASHYCYAVHIGEYEYCSDDGEPSHSAGLPILNSLRSGELDHVMIVVIRYFGGTKLGLPRLTKAYRDVSKSVVNEANKVELISGIKAKITLDYSSFETFKRMANRKGISIKNPVFETKVSFFAIGSDKILLPLIKELEDKVISTENVLIKLGVKE